MTEQPFAQADADWLSLIATARQWFDGPHGQLLLQHERTLLEDELARFFGGYLVHYGPSAAASPATSP